MSDTSWVTPPPPYLPTESDTRPPRGDQYTNHNTCRNERNRTSRVYSWGSVGNNPPEETSPLLSGSPNHNDRANDVHNDGNFQPTTRRETRFGGGDSFFSHLKPSHFFVFKSFTSSKPRLPNFLWFLLGCIITLSISAPSFFALYKHQGSMLRDCQNNVELKEVREQLSFAEKKIEQLTEELELETEIEQICQRERGKVMEERDRFKYQLKFAETQIEELKKELGGEKKMKEKCQRERENVIDERDKLLKEKERRDGLDLIQISSKMGTGGGSWVCSDNTPSWSFGYTTTQPPNPSSLVKIYEWSSSFGHSAHFTPESSTTINPSIEKVSIVGYEVISKHHHSKNGWWRRSRLEAFGEDSDEVEFHCKKSVLHNAQYEAKVWYVIMALGGHPLTVGEDHFKGTDDTTIEAKIDNHQLETTFGNENI